MKLVKLLPGLILLSAVALLGVSCAPKPETVVRQRAQAYNQLLLEEKFDEAVNYYDPDVVVRRGRTGVAGGMKLVVGLAKGLNQLGGRQTAGVEIRKLDFATDKTHASLQVVFLTTDAKGQDRKEIPVDQKWVLKKDTWFVTE
jgi:hypothetical protein